MATQNETLVKSDFMVAANLDSTTLTAKDLFKLLLPKFVLDGAKNILDLNGTTIVDENIGDVAILFCDISATIRSGFFDIADFDDIVRKQEHNIVYLLDKIFRKFDDLCNLHGIQKIETVGKTYMAAAGITQVEEMLPQSYRALNPPVNRVLTLAKAMLREIENFEGLNLKIGVHVGKPVMGVIGYHKPQFSLIGDVVNTTSRHCTTGKKGRIMVSAEAVRALGQSFTLSTQGFRTKVVPTHMKGKGMVDVYHLSPSNNYLWKRMKNIAKHGYVVPTLPDSSEAEVEESEKALQTIRRVVVSLSANKGELFKASRMADVVIEQIRWFLATNTLKP